MSASFPDLRTAARLLGGEVSGGQVLFAPPGHDRRDRSACLRPVPAAPGGFIIKTFSPADDPLAVKDFVRERLGLDRWTASETSGRQEVPAGRKFHCAAKVGAGGKDDAERTASALAIWAGSCSPAGTPVQAYLARRGLTLPDEQAEVLRYHAHCPFTPGKRTPAMVALVRDIVTNAPKAIHRTALSLDGQKVEVNGKDRRTLSPVAGGAIKLTPDEDVTLALGIGEGIESTLSLRELPEFQQSPVWSVILAPGIATFPVLAGIECLWVAVDHDLSGAGDKAALACADRWREAGREVFLVRPHAEESDLNDVTQGRRRHAGR